MALQTGPIPLLLGVTGHQDIDPAQFTLLRETVKAVFRRLANEYPTTQLVLLSPLAPGADRLVAEVALGMGSVVRFVAIVPSSSTEVVGDTAQAATDSERERLLKRAEQIVRLPPIVDETTEPSSGNPVSLERQRDDAGRYIARHSQILIAVWDGRDLAESHTAKVVRWHREGAPAPYAARVGELDVAEQAAVCHLHVRRKPKGETDVEVSRLKSNEDSRASGEEPIVPRWEYPKLSQAQHHSKMPKQWPRRIIWTVQRLLLAIHRIMHVARRAVSVGTDEERILKQRWQSIERFNADVAAFPPKDSKTILQSRQYLIPDDVAVRQAPCVQSLREIYALADTAAGYWQKRTWWTVFVLFVVAFLAVASLETYAHLLEDLRWLAGYLICLAVGYATFRWTSHHEFQGRWLDYRALAEALRVQTFWRWAGLTDCVADHYLRNFRGELDWIRHAARGAYLTSGGHAAESSHIESRARGAELELVRKHWVADQQAYFAGKAPYNAEVEICFETAARLAFLGAVLIACFHLAYHTTTHHMSHGLILATFGCLVVAAFLEGFADIHAYALLARRYQWMAELYGNAQHKLDQLLKADNSQADIARVQELLFELGLEALAENADWVTQHRERPPILPSG